MEFGFTQGANEDDDSTASDYQDFLLNATQFEDDEEGEEEVERSPQQPMEVVNILEDEETNDGSHLGENNQNEEEKAIEADPSSFRTGISSVSTDGIMEVEEEEEEEDELDLQISQTLREITEMDEQALRISQLQEHNLNSQALKRDVTTERSEVFIDLSEQEENKPGQPQVGMNFQEENREEKQEEEEILRDTKQEMVEITEIDIDETQVNEIDLHISQTPCDYIEENLANHLYPVAVSPTKDVEQQNLEDSAVSNALASEDKEEDERNNSHSQEKLDEPSEDEQNNMEEDEINLHISQTPGDYGASQSKAGNSLRENLQEENKALSGNAPENFDNNYEETDDELNLHITQSQFPAEQISENEKLKELNATYVSPVKADHLQPKRIESINDSETQFEENLQLNVDAGEEDDETDINLCITPSQPQNFLPTDLDLTPIIPSTSDQKKDKEEEDLNQTSKSMIMIDPFQFMIQPSNNNDNKEETGTTNHYSIYDFLQGTPNQLSGLSIIKNRGDISMYSTANVNSGGGGGIDNDATQLDHLPSSQTFLSKANSITSQFIDKSDEKLQPVNLGDNKEEKKELKLPTSRDETINKAEVVENDSPDWLEANDRIPSTKIRSKDNSSGTTKNSSSSSDITSNDVDTLKELYEKKLKELEELKKAMEMAAQSSVKADEPIKKKESQDDGFQASQLPTEEYAKILTSLANTTAPSATTAQTDNQEKAKQSKEVVTAKKVLETSSNRSGGSGAFGSGWDDDSGPLIAAPQRKFNTFAKISSPVSATKTGNDGIELNSAEKVSKFRRKFAGGTPTAPNGPSSLSREVDSSPEKRRIHFDFDLTDTAPPDFEDEKEVKKIVEKGKEKEKEKAEKTQEKVADSNSKRDTKEDPKVIEKKKEIKDIVASVESATKQSDKKKSDSASKVVPALPSSSSERGVRDYIPVSFKEGKVPQKFAEVWPVLESIGWRWTKGKGLIDFYYIRPDAKAAPPFVLNQDYFSTTDDLLAYVHSKCPASATKEKSEKSGESTTRLRKIKKNLIISDDDEEEEFSVTLNTKGQSLTSKKQPSKTLSDKKSNKEESDYQEESESDEEEENEDADDDENDEEEEEEEEKYDLRTIPWKDLWKILRSYGWSWDFGPNVLNYFYVPKFSFKRDKEAVLGVHKFTNEDEIRRYLKREYRHRMQQQKEVGNVKKGNQNTDDEAEGDEDSMWSLFYLSSNGSNNSQNASTQESQYLLDNLAEDWTLAKNRKKRNREDPNTSTSTTGINQTKKDIKSSKNTIQQQQQSKKQKINENPKRDDKQQGRKSSSGPKIPSTPESNYGEEVNTQIPTLSPERFQPSSSTKKLKPVTATTTPHHQNNTEGDRNSFIKQNHEKSLKFDSATIPSSDKVKAVKNDRKSVSPVPEQALLSSSTTPTHKLSSSLFANMKFLFSGIQEDVRERLEHLVKKNGGAVLSDIPKDINYYEENFLAFQQPSLRATSNSPYFHRERVYNSNDDDDDDEKEDQKDDKNLRMKEMIVLISQAKDFRKPKFITAVIIGIPILHINFIFDCLLTSSLQSFDSYYLPITYSALHSYNLVPKNPLFTYVHQVKSTSHGKGNATKALSKQYLPYVFRSFPHPSRHLSNNKGKKTNEEYQGIFSNYRILNLTGMKIWDDILLLCHAQLLPRHDKALYKQLLSSPSNTSNKGQTVDLIMFDPISYTKSIIYHANQRRSGNLPSSEHIAKQLLLTDQEIRTLQQSHQKMQEMAASSSKGAMAISEGVKVVSIDWITHCIALNEVIHHHALDLFLLPSDPIHYPMALKLEPDVTGIPTTAPNSNTVNTGERYSKYDLVYFHASIPSLSNSTGTSTSTLAVGKILSFSRRNESSVPLVKVQLLDTQTQVPTPSPVQNSSSSSGNKRKHVMIEEGNSSDSAVKLLVPKKFTAEMIVSVAQLAGKVIVLHRKNYYKLYQARPANANSSVENKKQLLQSAKDDKKSQKKEKDNEQAINTILKEDDVYSTGLDYERQYSVIPYQLRNEEDEDDEVSEEYGSDESDDGLGRKRKRFVLSQDI